VSLVVSEVYYGKLGRDSDMSENIRDSAMMRALIYIKHKM
jgi:hypothetical protein